MKKSSYFIPHEIFSKDQNKSVCCLLMLISCSIGFFSMPNIRKPFDRLMVGTCDCGLTTVL